MNYHEDGSITDCTPGDLVRLAGNMSPAEVGALARQWTQDLAERDAALSDARMWCGISFVKSAIMGIIALVLAIITKGGQP